MDSVIFLVLKRNVTETLARRCSANVHFFRITNFLRITRIGQRIRTLQEQD